MLLVALVFSCACAAAFLLLYLLIFLKFVYFPFQVFKRNGIKGPTPRFFYGNYKERLKIGATEYAEALHKEFGSVVGYYVGIQPFVLVSDIELLKKITVTDFESFIDRPRLPDMMDKKYRPDSLLGLRGEHWKASRHTLSPSFSSFKIRALTPIIKSSADVLVEVFAEHADTGKSFECYKTFGSYTMEVIIATSFGRAVNIQKNQSDELTKAAAKIFTMASDADRTNFIYLILLLSNLPWMEYVLRWYFKGNERQKSYRVIYEATLALLKERRKEKDTEKYKDLLQLMINTVKEDSSKDESLANGKEKNAKSKEKRLTDTEIIGHSMTFMLAGYETTANTLSYTAYLLALHPHVQERLQAEIDDYFQQDPEASLYQATQDLTYLDMVLQESLRIFTPVPIYGRECHEDYTYNGMTIPKNSIVVLCTTILHNDPQYWKDPEKFDPLRFSSEEKAKRPPLCYVPFGFGPRSCIGGRLAQVKAKVALIQLLRNYSFVRAPDTQVPLDTVVGISRSPRNGIYLQVASRSTTTSKKAS